MPYAKKRSYKKTKPSTKVPKATRTYVKKAIEVEKETNWVDQYEPDSVEMNFDNITNTALFPPAQGDSISTRDGDRIEPTRLHGCYNILFPAAGIVARVIMFQWKPDNAVETPNLGKILDDTTAYSTTANYVGDAVARKKFKILYDKIIPNPTGVANQIVVRKFDITKFSAKYIYFNTGSTNGKNQVYVYLLSNISLASAGPSLSGHFRSEWKE